MTELFNFESMFDVDTSVDVTAEAQGTIIASLILEQCTSDEILAFTENFSETALAQQESILMERNIVKLDKKAKLNRAYKTAIFQVAKEKKDPKFKKLVKLWKMERYIEAELEKKYGNAAMKRAKQSMTAASKSKVSVASKAANRAKSSSNKK